MSIQYKPDPKTEARYDIEAEQIVKYLSGHDSKGNPDPFWQEGYEKFAANASIPLMMRLDKLMAEQGES